VDEIVAKHLVLREELTQSTRVGLPSGEETNPDGGVDEHHYATRRLRAGFSLRLGTSWAAGSEPRNARSRSYAAWRRSASSPRRTASVSVVAPLTVRASARSAASMWSVFFIWSELPYWYISHNRITYSAAASVVSVACLIGREREPHLPHDRRRERPHAMLLRPVAARGGGRVELPAERPSHRSARGIRRRQAAHAVDADKGRQICCSSASL
jgi:hypothetical protein